MSLCPSVIPYSPPCYPLDRLMHFSKTKQFFPIYKLMCVHQRKPEKQWKSQNKCTDPPIHTNVLIDHCSCLSSLGLKAIHFYWKTECHTAFPKMTSISEDSIKAAKVGSCLRLAGTRGNASVYSRPQHECMHTCVRSCLPVPWEPSEYMMGTPCLRSLALSIKKRAPPTKTMLFQYPSVYHFKGALLKIFF